MPKAGPTGWAVLQRVGVLSFFVAWCLLCPLEVPEWQGVLWGSRAGSQSSRKGQESVALYPTLSFPGASESGWE